MIELFPAGTTIDADGTLVVGGCRLDDVAREHGTPVMVVAEDAVRQRARAYREGLAERWPRSQVAFASKAFACTARRPNDIGCAKREALGSGVPESRWCSRC